jgi:enamine deaminase RidA (YjgF/YER057c/UK114 family)
MEGPMSSELINPAGLPRAVGFSHLAETSQGLIFLAGQTGHHQDGSIAPGLVKQFAQACRNVHTCLLSVGAGPDDLVSLQIYVTDMAAYRLTLPELGVAYREVFGKRYPPIALIGVSELFDPAALVELVGVATAP